MTRHDIAPLPVDDVIADIRTRLAQSRRLLLQSPPGSGKTTHVPLALLDEAWLASQTIVMLEPRRLAAKAAARRMAQLLGEEVGQTVGYRVRFDSCISKQTRIEVVTEGILTRRLQSDPMLEGVGLVIFDEFHERHLHSDLAFVLCLDVWQGLRDDLRVAVMSATLDINLLKKRFSDGDLVSAEGRSYAVDIRYVGDVPTNQLIDRTVQTVTKVLDEEEGDVLLFLPGVGEIKRTVARLREQLSTQHVELLPLYGDLKRSEQDRIFSPVKEGLRRVVISTPIAESSLTIEGIRIVIDSGLAREPRFDPRSGLTGLRTVRISKASAEQRAGRAGRMAPGVCYRLWGEGTQRGLLAHAVPEIDQADLAPLALELAAWGVTDPAMLPWVSLPPIGAMSQARAQLQELEAIDSQGRVTALGREMVALPLHPRLAHMLLWARDQDKASVGCDVAALLSERDLLAASRREVGCDLAARYDLLQCYRREGRRVVKAQGGDPEACARVDQVAKQWRRLLKCGAPSIATNHADHADLGALIAQAYPERIGQRRNQGEGRYLLAGGNGVSLWPEDPLCASDYLAVAQVDAAQGEGRVFLAAQLSLEEIRMLYPTQVVSQDEVRWDSEREAVISERVERFHALKFKRTPLRTAAPEMTSAVMLEGIAKMGLACLPWDDSARQWQARVLALRSWFPDDSWPDVSDAALSETLVDWLAPYLNGIQNRAQLSRLKLMDIFTATLTWDMQQQLDRLAPLRVAIPSGRTQRLHYELDGPPVLAVKLQELFGLTETPSVAQGRIAVVLHLLSPAGRPLQVTQDLISFWHNTYPEVKKEMKGRYPKHPWPDDPMTALPTARTKRRS